MHMIPANDGIERQLKSLRLVNLVRIKGFLVEVSNKEGLHWKSSLTRSDTGAGACELLWVESLRHGKSSGGRTSRHSNALGVNRP